MHAGEVAAHNTDSHPLVNRLARPGTETGIVLVGMIHVGTAVD